jgi:methionyl aminopeptidase
VSIESPIEGVGVNYSVHAMLDTRLRTRRALRSVAARVEVGMSEHDARSMARDTLEEMGLRRGWHPTLVRFGPNTLRQFLDRDGGDVVLRSDDIFFVDIGPVYNDVEGDAGETFTTGHNPEHLRAASDVFEVWNEVRDAWFYEHRSGRDLYAFAERACRDRDWRLNLDLTGHRISDYPHKAHFNGPMSKVDIVPSPDLWVLEIGLAHPDRSFGAFYEDTLLEDQSFDDASPTAT